ncbi:MAG TPA: hypothetical protein VG722_11400 [Tepidisphaeraceae bacterium]|nr:hypothetical protein [Tepidisphaeraceae bacterium]
MTTAFDLLRTSGRIDGPTSQAATQLVSAVSDYQCRYRNIQTALESSKFLGDSQSVRLWRLASFVEDQHRLSREKALEIGQSRGEFNTVLAAHAAFPDFAGVKHNLQNIWEGLVENTELAIRYMLHRDQLPIPISVGSLRTPYRDPELHRFLSLAATWRQLQFAFSNLRYGEWERVRQRLKSESGDVDVETLQPTDRRDFFRQHLSFIRHQLFTVEMAGPVLENYQSFSDNLTGISPISGSISPPVAGSLWDGRIDMAALGRAAQNSMLAEELDLAIDALHYRPWVRGLVVPYGRGTISWKNWVCSQVVIRILAEAFTGAIDRVLHPDADRSLSGVVRISRKKLAQILSAAGGLTEQDSSSCIESLIFDPVRKGSDWWDMPLIPLSTEEVLLVPSIVTTANPVRALESSVRRGSKEVSKRSESFNEHILKPFIAVGAKAKKGLKVDGSDGREIEFDGMAWWQGKLILLEAKCLRALDGAHDDWRAGIEIDEAVKQLIRRRAAVHRDWDKIRSRLSDWELPTQPPHEGDIICIAVTNVLRFTPTRRNGVFLTDALCLRKFFAGDPHIYYRSTSGESRPISRFRIGDDPTVSEFASYLEAPPQFRWIVDGLTPQWNWIYPVKHETPIRFLGMAFHGHPEGPPKQ